MIFDKTPKTIWVPTLTGIALMFGGGNAFDSIVSGVAYYVFRKRLWSYSKSQHQIES